MQNVASFKKRVGGFVQGSPGEFKKRGVVPEKQKAPEKNVRQIKEDPQKKIFTSMGTVVPVKTIIDQILRDERKQLAQKKNNTNIRWRGNGNLEKVGVKKKDFQQPRGKSFTKAGG